MKFVGTVIIYAYLQAVGVINSHESGCFLNPLQQSKMQKIKHREVDSNCQCLPAIIFQINIVRIMVYISFPIGKWRKRPATDPVLSR